MFIVVNSTYPDETPLYAVSHQGDAIYKCSFMGSFAYRYNEPKASHSYVIKSQLVVTH